MRPDQTAKLLRLRELRLRTAEIALSRASRKVDAAEHNRKMAETIVTLRERQREKASQSAYEEMPGATHSALSFERFQNDLNRIAEDCKTAAEDLRAKERRLNKDERIRDEKRALVRGALTERSTWEAIDEKARKILRRSELQREDASDEELLEDVAVRRS